MNKKDKKKKQNEKRKPQINSFPKLALMLILIHGMACVTASYVLAFINHMTVVENLSITIVGQIVAPFICYTIGSTVGNIFEKNQLSFSTPLTAIQSGIVQSTTTASTSYNNDNLNIEEQPVVGSIDNPIDLDELPLFEFGGESGKGDD